MVVAHYCYYGNAGGGRSGNSAKRVGDVYLHTFLSAYMRGIVSH